MKKTLFVSFIEKVGSNKINDLDEIGTTFPMGGNLKTPLF
jgi:hypothetical protein